MIWIVGLVVWLVLATLTIAFLFFAVRKSNEVATERWAGHEGRLDAQADILERRDKRILESFAKLQEHVKETLVLLRTRGVLSAQMIQQLGIVSPCRVAFKFNGLSGGLSSCGYDISLLNEINVPPGCFKLGASFEKFDIPANVVGIVHDKSTWARQGLALQNTVLEPGWRGYLTLEISNHGKRSIRIPGMTPIAQVVFSFLNEETNLPYAGKYQDQQQGAVEAKFDSPTGRSMTEPALQNIPIPHPELSAVVDAVVDGYEDHELGSEKL